MKRIVSIFMVVVLICSLSSVYADDLSSRSALTDFWDKLKFAWGCDDATSLICAACGENISFDQLQSPLCPYCGDELLTKNGALKYGGFGGGSSRGGGAGRDGTPALSSDGRLVVYATPSYGSDFSSNLKSFSSISGNTFFFDFPGGSSDFTLIPCNHKYKPYSSYVAVTTGLDWTVNSVPVDGTYYPVFEFKVLSGQWSLKSIPASSGSVFGSGISGVSGFPLKLDWNYALSDYSYIKSVYNSDVKVYYPVSATIRLYFLYSADKDFGVVDDSNVDTASKVVNIDNSTSITYNTAYNYGDTYIVYDSNNNPSVLVRDQSGQVIAASYFDEEANAYMVTVHNGFSFGSSSGSDSGSSSDDEEDDEPGGLWGWIFKKIVAAIEGIFGTIGDLIGALFLGLLTLINSVLSNITDLTGLLDGVSESLVSIFSFLPEEFRKPLSAAFSIYLLISVFKMIRK